MNFYKCLSWSVSLLSFGPQRIPDMRKGQLRGSSGIIECAYGPRASGAPPGHPATSSAFAKRSAQNDKRRHRLGHYGYGTNGLCSFTLSSTLPCVLTCVL